MFAYVKGDILAPVDSDLENSTEAQATLDETMAEDNQFLVPFLSSWEDRGVIVHIGDKYFLVAPDDIEDANCNPFWRFSEAQEIAEKFKGTGWRLPTPLEIDMIFTSACYISGAKNIDPNILSYVFGIHKIGYGYILNQNEKPRRRSAASEVAYWTDSLRDTSDDDCERPESGIVYRIMAGTGSLSEYITEERAACVRLIKELSPDSLPA